MGTLTVEFSFPSYLFDDFNPLMKLVKKNHSQRKLNGKKQLLWSCFAFITRNMDQNMATKSLLARMTKQPKTAKLENHPIMHCKLILDKYTSCRPMGCVSVDALLIPVAKSLL